jgi:hypothetical protein
MEDLVKLVEGNKFVGQEFLVWLWFETELFEGTLELRDGSQCELWLENHLTLARDKELASLKGQAPSANAEAHEALRQGKLPTRACVRVLRNELEYGFVLTADDLALSSVKIPAQLKQEKEEQFYERMYLLEELENMIEGLFADFLLLRLGKAWDASVLPAVRLWVKEDAADVDGYRRKRAEALSKRPKPRD